MKSNIQDHIDEIMDNFDFARVHNAMVALKWEWSSTGGVPELSQVKKMARKLLRETMENKDLDNGSYISTGGFKVSKYEKHYELSFEVESWDSAFLMEIKC